LWTFLPGLLHTAYRADVLEQLLTGREWVPASARHPALPAIMLELINLVTGRAFFSPFLVSQFCMFLTVWAVWKLGRTVLTPFLALTASLSILSYHFFTIESIKYNHNLPYIAFWTLSILFVHESVRTNKLIYWIIAGITIGLDLNSKFSSVLLVFTILLFFGFDSKARKTWQTPGPYLTTAIAFLLFLPQIIWAVFRYKIPLPDYVANPEPLSFFVHFFITMRFLFSQIGYLILPLIILLTAVRIPFKKRTDLTSDQQWSCRFLTAMIFLPLIWHVFFSLGYLESVNGEYGAPIWPIAGILFFLFFQSKKELNNSLFSEAKSAMVFKRFGMTVLMIELLLVTVFVIQS
jgi:4-amino-4-deoxy-L-arabinose transferase-like glycosyltransferase